MSDSLLVKRIEDVLPRTEPIWSGKRSFAKNLFCLKTSLGHSSRNIRESCGISKSGLAKWKREKPMAIEERLEDLKRSRDDLLHLRAEQLAGLMEGAVQAKAWILDPENRAKIPAHVINAASDSIMALDKTGILCRKQLVEMAGDQNTPAVLEIKALAVAFDRGEAIDLEPVDRSDKERN